MLATLIFCISSEILPSYLLKEKLLLKDYKNYFALILQDSFESSQLTDFPLIVATAVILIFNIMQLLIQLHHHKTVFVPTTYKYCGMKNLTLLSLFTPLNWQSKLLPKK